MGSEDDYGKAMFARADFATLAEQLRQVTGRFLLSINDVPEIRALFAWAQFIPVTSTYSIANHVGRAAPRGELLVAGPSDWLSGLTSADRS